MVAAEYDDTFQRLHRDCWLTAYFSHTKDYFIQLLYQNPDRLVQTYRTLNEDYMQQAGIQATIPFAVGDWWNAQTRFIGAWQREKDSDFYDIPFDRHIFFGMFVMNNTFTLSKKHNLKLLVNGMIRSKGIQGNYDLLRATMTCPLPGIWMPRCDGASPAAGDCSTSSAPTSSRPA